MKGKKDMNTEFKFGVLKFSIVDEKIYMIGCGSFQIDEQNETQTDAYRFVEIQVAGEHKDSHMGIKMGISSEGSLLKYVSHRITENCLEIIQRSKLVEVKSVFISYHDTQTIRTYTEVKNISKEEITLEEVSAFKGVNFGNIRDSKDIYLYKFYQGHHTECQPRRLSLFDMGLIRYAGHGSKRVASCNVGSWSTKEELPQGIIEYNGYFTMFQIESNHSWYYEISDDDTKLYLYLSGANSSFGSWAKKLQPNGTYKTVTVAVSFSDSLNGVLEEITKYRRHIKGNCETDRYLPTIFNEYMHLSWDSPEAEKTKIYAPIVADMGIEYYVIDCGWHDEEPGYMIYPYMGKWKESKTRFPEGVRKTTDYIRSLGMKAGLWIEPEIVGSQCKEMLDYYDEDCFIRRDGKKVCTMNRYFLDYRHPKVIEYMTETIRRMVDDYGADYIKLDYNADLGVGTELDCDSFGDGLEQSAAAYLKWIDAIRKRHPDVLFETCASGGNRMDYQTLSHFSIVSTSDQTRYKWYPYIAGNILSAVLPEQAAVWSYPVDSYGEPNAKFTPDFQWVQEHISEEQVIMNMINSFLGRMHLASHLELLDEKKKALVKEGVAYFKELSKVKEAALPFMLNGFCNFGDELVVSGLRYDNILYLAVWNLGNTKERKIQLGKPIESAEIVFPQKYTIPYSVNGECLDIMFTEDYQARFFEIHLK